MDLPSITTTNAYDLLMSCGGNLAGSGLSFSNYGGRFTVLQTNSGNGAGSSMCERQLVSATDTYSPTVGVSPASAGYGMTSAVKSQ